MDFFGIRPRRVAAERERRRWAEPPSKPSVVATVPVTDLPGWIAVRQRLSGIATIERTDLLSLDRHNARIAIHYVGGQAQLQLALAQRNLELSGGDPNWVLERRTSAPQP